jgi:predicted Zn-dependent protease
LATTNISKARELLNKIKVTFQKEVPSFYMLEGRILLAERRFVQALESFKKVEEMYPSATALYLELGKNYLALNRLEDAKNAFLNAIDLEGDHPFAYHGLGIVYKRMGLLEEAVEELLKAIDLLYFYPAAHYHLAETLALMEDYDHALEAFKVTVKLAPGMKRAHQWLVKIYEEQMKDSSQANEHRRFMRENIKQKITIVSGLPRSGTSMMMQALAAGGMDILTDGLRKPDDNNPKGYLEFEPVKKLASDNSWVKDAQGKTVKVIAQLLQYLPAEFEYKIIFMKREMDQVLRSQQIMLKKDSEIKSNTYPAVIASAFSKQLQQLENWFATQPHMEVLQVNYSDVINNPDEQMQLIADFLEEELSVDEMVKSVDPSLFRNNKSVWA